MNLEKFTERSRGAIQAAQTIGERESHGRLGPEHLLKACLLYTSPSPRDS